MYIYTRSLCIYSLYDGQLDCSYILDTNKAHRCYENSCTSMCVKSTHLKRIIIFRNVPMVAPVEDWPMKLSVKQCHILWLNTLGCPHASLPC